MWHTSRTFRALTHTFSVHAQDPVLIERINWAYIDLSAVDTGATSQYQIPVREGRPFPYEVYRDGHLIATSLDRHHALAWLQWEVNRLAATSAPGPVLHAGAAADAAGAVLIAGRSGAGKSTITAHMVKHGSTYLTDEAVAFDDSGRIVPYPKPFALDRASVAQLGIAARLPPPFDCEASDKELVPAGVLGAVERTARSVALVLLPERADRDEHVTSISRAEALQALMGHRHSDRPIGAPDLDRVASAIRDARCLLIVARSSSRIAALAREDS